MLPFLSKNTREASVSAPVESVERKPDDEQDYDSMHAAAEDLISAIHSKDTAGVADALKAAFQIYESIPHEDEAQMDKES